MLVYPGDIIRLKKNVYVYILRSNGDCRDGISGRHFGPPCRLFAGSSMTVMSVMSVMSTREFNKFGILYTIATFITPLGTHVVDYWEQNTSIYYDMYYERVA